MGSVDILYIDILYIDISTDPILVTWQNTVYEPPPPEDGFKKRPKHVEASVKFF